jgi:hypothetical protein
VRVRVDGNAFNILSWTFTFNPYSNPGPQPLLRITSTANLSGNSSAVYVTRLTQGSTDFFYGPIPGEFLRLPLDAPTATPVGADAFPANLTSAAAAASNSSSESTSEVLQLLDVVVNGVVSACGAAAVLQPGGSAAAITARSCAFSYSAAATPTVTAVSPAALIAGESLSISGSGFKTGNASANRVWLGGAPCTVASASHTQLLCVTADNTTAGEHEVNGICIDGLFILYHGCTSIFPCVCYLNVYSCLCMCPLTQVQARQPCPPLLPACKSPGHGCHMYICRCSHALLQSAF